MFCNQFILFALLILIGLTNIYCDDTKNIVNIKDFETKNSNSADLAKDLRNEEHEGASNNKNSNKTQRIKARKQALFNETISNITTTILPIIINDTKISNHTNKVLTTTTSRPPNNVSQTTEKIVILPKNNTISNSSTTATTKIIILKNDTNVVAHKGREGVTSKPEEIKSKISQQTEEIKIKTTTIPTTANKNLTTNSTSTSQSPPLAKNDTVNLNKTKSEIILTSTQLPNSTLSISSTTSTSTTSSTTTTTTTKKPKKPKITYSTEDMPLPSIGKVEPNKLLNPIGSVHNNITKNNLQIVDEPVEQPNAEPSREINDFHNKGHRDYILPIVGFIFILPILMVIIIISYRKFNDYWSTRHYRRMDFLVDGMYND